MLSQNIFNNIEITFSHRNNAYINRAYYIFKFIGIGWVTKYASKITMWALKLKLPILFIIKKTIFKHFCGGENIQDCQNAILDLAKGNVKTILDYSVEGEKTNDAFDAAEKEIITTIKTAYHHPHIPLTVFKPTSVGNFDIYAKINNGEELTSNEKTQYTHIVKRITNICNTAYELNIPIMIDAEESWIQNAVDHIAMEMMQKFNKKNIIVYNTYQMYLSKKLNDLTKDIDIAKQKQFILGAKLVRGAYMEKERQRAIEMNYTSPINIDKAATDKAYNEAVLLCIQNINNVAVVIGTHNEYSCQTALQLLNEYHISLNHPHIYFSQLLGMSDNISFNLAHLKCNVAKYMPYGPVKSVLPYLLRRAQENTAIAGQMSRELFLLTKEKKRRKNN